MKNKVIALLQARTDSTRLPNKVLKTILDKPMIIHQLKRTSKSKLIDRLVLLTSDEKNDDKLAQIITDNGFNIFRGDKNNVLKRFYDSIVDLNLNDNDIIVRLTGDCPLHDANIIDEAITSFVDKDCDYLANCVNPVYPDGLDVEVFNYKSLKLSYENATLKSELEHVTPYIRNNKKLKIKNLEKEPIYSNWRLTVDEENDLKLIIKIYEYFNNTYFTFNEIVEYLKNNQHLLNINNNIKRNEGYRKSLLGDNEMQGKKYIEEEADKWFDRNSERGGDDA